MRGYLSFLLVLLGSLALAGMLELYQAASAFDFSGSVAIERAYGLEMNAKEAVLESVRQGAYKGFSGYDLSHDVRECIHCLDNACAPPVEPLPPNYCDEIRCPACFRESEARAAALSGSEEALGILASHSFDLDFQVGFGTPGLSAFLSPDPLSKNGFRLDYMRFTLGFPIKVSSGKFGIIRNAEIPGGFSVDIG